jgi:NAD+ synthase (glutamine-hydrolysing)
VKIALAQVNPTPGDLDGNRARCGRFVDEALRRGAQLVVLPELSLSGYPPKGLLDRHHFVAQNRSALMTFAGSVYKINVVVGFIDHDPSASSERRIFNAVAAVKNGQIVSIHHKSVLGSHAGFDERGHFVPARQVRPVIIDGRTLGISISHDLFADVGPDGKRRDVGPVHSLVEGGADLLVTPGACPYAYGARNERSALLEAAAKRWERPLVFVNQVGGNDELVFDGRSVALDSNGEVLARAREFAEDLVVVDVESDTGEIHDLVATEPAAALDALSLGVKDFAEKSGFHSAVVGLSGGIDSALVCAVAARALGPGKVLGVALPSPISSPESEAAARALAQNLGIQYQVVPIGPAQAALTAMLAPLFHGLPPDVTEENLQARVRCTVLMALANKLGHLPLNTSNRSELLVGYGTLYGDLGGALAVLGDIPKTLVYELAAEVNREREIIPKVVFERPPSAELHPGQTDQDDLPPYEVLDPLLAAYLDRGLDAPALVRDGGDAVVVRDVLRRIARSQFKRHQAAPTLRIVHPDGARPRALPVVSGWVG